MKYINAKSTKTNQEVKIAYSDYGEGRPVVLIHGWPLSREMWEYQIDDLVNDGYRVIKYDRRGFGDSSKPWDGYDYDTLTSDLNDLMEQLDLMDVTLVGFSMGGGEVVRYLKIYGEKRVKQIVLISSVTPFLLKTDENIEGVDESVFNDILKEIREDRIAFLDGFGKKFFGINVVSHPVSTPLLDYYRMLASLATSRSTQRCAIAFATTDFRDDIAAIKVPCLIIHGDADKTVLVEASSQRTATMIPGCRYIVYEGAPHGLFYTHRGQLNRDLLQFFSGSIDQSTTFNEKYLREADRNL